MISWDGGASWSEVYPLDGESLARISGSPDAGGLILHKQIKPLIGNAFVLT